MKSYQNDDLLLGIRKGDSIAFGEFYKATFFEMCKYAETFNVNSDFAYDTVMESYEKAWDKRKDFHAVASLIAFLRITIRNACLNRIKWQNRYPHSPSDDHHIPATDNNELEKLQLKETALDIIYQEIESLPDQCKIIFKHHYFDGLSTNHIADRMNLSPQTVRNQLTRAKQLLRTEILKKGLENILVLVIVSGIIRALY